MSPIKNAIMVAEKTFVRDTSKLNIKVPIEIPTHTMIATMNI